MAERSNLQQRVISAIVLVTVALALTWAGGVWYRLLCVTIGSAILYEWLTMTLTRGARSHATLVAILLAPVLILILWGATVHVQLVALLGAVVLGALHAAYGRSGFWATGGIIYAGASTIALAALRGEDSAGLAVTLFVFAIVWATDILAYFVGRAVGGPKLAPSISPGKTWSGAFGGTFAGVAAGFCMAMAFAGKGALSILVVALFLSVLSQIGDLFESKLKRVFSVKDSSRLIPGHGGVMDRVDGLVAAAFALFVMGSLIAGPDRPAHAFFGG